jgi:hypothetical protein
VQNSETTSVAVPTTSEPASGWPAAWAGDIAAPAAFAGLTFTGHGPQNWAVHFNDHGNYLLTEDTLKRDQLARAGAHLAELLKAIWPLARPDDPPLGCAPPPSSPGQDFIHQPNFYLAVALLKQRLVYYRCTSYDADLARIIDEALDWVKVRAPEVRSAGMNPAIVLDIDETSLSNWTRIYRDSFAYIPNGDCDLDDNTKPCGDLAWQRAGKAPAIGPTLNLYKFARCLEQSSPCVPIEVFFVTGRREGGAPIENKTPRQWTRDNLIAAGYSGRRPSLFARNFRQGGCGLQVWRARHHRIQVPSQDHREHRRSAKRSRQRTCRPPIQAAQSVLLHSLARRFERLADAGQESSVQSLEAAPSFSSASAARAITKSATTGGLSAASFACNGWLRRLVDNPATNPPFERNSAAVRPVGPAPTTSSGSMFICLIVFLKYWFSITDDERASAIQITTEVQSRKRCTFRIDTEYEVCRRG